MTDFETFDMTNYPEFFKEFDSTNINQNNNKETKFNIEEFMKKAKILVKFTNSSNNPDPEYAHEGDSGFDLRAFIGDRIVIEPGKRALIPTGLCFELPESYEMQIRPRSGLAKNYGVMSTLGTIDNPYRGEIIINIFNFGESSFVINNGDRIAQGVISPRLSTEFGLLEKVEQLTSTKRHDSGFGSTGVQ